MTDAAQSLHTLGVKNLIITLGARGAALWEDGAEELRNIPCIQAPQVADPTAAGDSFVAAFSVGVCTGLAFREAAVFASYTAALTVSKAGAIPSLPDLQAVAAFMEERALSQSQPARLSGFLCSFAAAISSFISGSAPPASFRTRPRSLRTHSGPCAGR